MLVQQPYRGGCHGTLKYSYGSSARPSCAYSRKHPNGCEQGMAATAGGTSSSIDLARYMFVVYELSHCDEVLLLLLPGRMGRSKDNLSVFTCLRMPPGILPRARNVMKKVCCPAEGAYRSRVDASVRRCCLLRIPERGKSYEVRCTYGAASGIQPEDYPLSHPVIDPNTIAPHAQQRTAPNARPDPPSRGPYRCICPPLGGQVYLRSLPASTSHGSCIAAAQAWQANSRRRTSELHNDRMATDREDPVGESSCPILACTHVQSGNNTVYLLAETSGPGPTGVP